MGGGNKYQTGNGIGVVEYKVIGTLVVMGAVTVQRYQKNKFL